VLRAGMPAADVVGDEGIFHEGSIHVFMENAMGDPSTDHSHRMRLCARDVPALGAQTRAYRMACA
jgi:hypothetical protein